MPEDLSASRDLPQAFMLRGKMLAWDTKVDVYGIASSEEDLHEGIIDRNNKDLAGVLELGVGNVARDVRVGAGWAWIMSMMHSLNYFQYQAPFIASCDKLQ